MIDSEFSRLVGMWEYHHGGVTAESSAEASALKSNVGSANLRRNLDSFARIWEMCIKTYVAL